MLSQVIAASFDQMTVEKKCQPTRPCATANHRRDTERRCSVVRWLFGCGLVGLLVVFIVPLFLSFLAMPGLCCFLRVTPSDVYLTPRASMAYRSYPNTFLGGAGTAPAADQHSALPQELPQGLHTVTNWLPQALSMTATQ